MDLSLYDYYLCKPCDPEEIMRLSNIVFVEGHLEKLDDLIVAILPLANIVYYKHIKYLDDREYAKGDLISDAILRLYQDMSLRWDKYIHIESYYTYFSTVLRNGMIGLVHNYHNFYMMDDVDPEEYDRSIDTAYEEVELEILKSSMKQEILEVSRRILKCRRVNTNLLLSILKVLYIDKSTDALENLKSRVKVLGISSKLFDFYCDHVRYVYKLAYNYQYAILGGKEKMAARIASTIDRFEDITYRSLSINYYDSIIPEIYAEFGADIAKKFVKTFSGRSIEVPEYTDFCDDLLGGVVVTLANGDKMNLYKVAEEYGIPYKTLSRIYNKAIKLETDKEEN